MKYSVTLPLVAIMLVVLGMSLKKGDRMTTDTESKNFYDYSALAINEKDTLKMSDYKGKMVLIVNVASECGYTPQYEGLQELQDTYGEIIQVIGFPCNQFGGQEPGSNEEVADFCKSNYGVTFPMAAKVDVKGENRHPLFKWLTTKELNGREDYTIGWNFDKFLISADGRLLAHFHHKIEPISEEMLEYLQPDR